MKSLRILCSLLAITLCQIAVAEQFIVINSTDKPLTCKVYSGDRWITFDGEIGRQQQSPIIDIKRSTLTWIWWSDGGKEYKVDFAGQVPLQRDKKNFFNIYGLGGYMHNFGGFKQQGLALINSQNGYVPQRK